MNCKVPEQITISLIEADLHLLLDLARRGAEAYEHDFRTKKKYKPWRDETGGLRLRGLVDIHSKSVQRLLLAIKSVHPGIE